METPHNDRPDTERVRVFTQSVEVGHQAEEEEKKKKKNWSSYITSYVIKHYDLPPSSIVYLYLSSYVSVSVSVYLCIYLCISVYISLTLSVSL